MSESERVARLEAITDEQERRLASIESKLDRLLEMAAIGKGSLWLLLKAATFMAAIGAAFAWAWDKLN
jgi:cell division protein ZapA (FtsZ GTPase activity inhibitor)